MDWASLVINNDIVGSISFESPTAIGSQTVIVLCYTCIIEHP